MKKKESQQENPKENPKESRRERERERESGSMWRDYVLLLGGSQRAGDVAAHLLAESISSHELPFVMHELCTVSLVSPSHQARLNAMLALELVCSTFSNELVELFKQAKSDGVLLTMEDIDVIAIASNGVKLFNIADESLSSDANGHDIYSRHWIKQQRLALKQRLGSETTRRQRSDVAAATKYVSTKELLSRRDVISGKEWTVKMDSTSSAASAPVDVETGSDIENWFVRLFRVLVVGLLHPEWKHRHGHCLGLAAILKGLLDRTTDKAEKKRIDFQVPDFLVQDVVTTVLSVLVLDRYVFVGRIGEDDEDEEVESEETSTGERGKHKEAQDGISDPIGSYEKGSRNSAEELLASLQGSASINETTSYENQFLCMNKASSKTSGIYSLAMSKATEDEYSSPVKEVAAQLLAVSLLYAKPGIENDEIVVHTLQRAVQLCKLDDSTNDQSSPFAPVDCLSLQHSGLLMIKHLLTQERCLLGLFGPIAPGSTQNVPVVPSDNCSLNSTYSVTKYSSTLYESLMKAVLQSIHRFPVGQTNIIFPSTNTSEIRDTAFRIFTSLAYGLQALYDSSRCFDMVEWVSPVLVQASQYIRDALPSIFISDFSTGRDSCRDLMIDMSAYGCDHDPLVMSALACSCIRCMEALLSIATIVLHNAHRHTSTERNLAYLVQEQVLECIVVMSKFLQTCAEESTIQLFYFRVHQLIDHYNILQGQSSSQDTNCVSFALSVGMRRLLRQVLNNLLGLIFAQETVLWHNCDDSNSNDALLSCEYLLSVNSNSEHGCNSLISISLLEALQKILFITLDEKSSDENDGRDNDTTACIKTEFLGNQKLNYQNEDNGLMWMIDVLQWVQDLFQIELAKDVKGNGQLPNLVREDLIRYLFVQSDNILSSYTVSDKESLEKLILRSTKSFAMFCRHFLHQCYRLARFNNSPKGVNKMLSLSSVVLTDLLKSTVCLLSDRIKVIVDKIRIQYDTERGSGCGDCQTPHFKRKFFVAQTALSSSSHNKRLRSSIRHVGDSIYENAEAKMEKKSYSPMFELEKATRSMILFIYVAIQLCHELTHFTRSMYHMDGDKCNDLYSAFLPFCLTIESVIANVQETLNPKHGSFMLTVGVKQSMRELNILGVFLQKLIVSSSEKVGCVVGHDGSGSDANARTIIDILDFFLGPCCKEIPRNSRSVGLLESSQLSIQEVLVHIISERVFVMMSTTSPLEKNPLNNVCCPIKTLLSRIRNAEVESKTLSYPLKDLDQTIVNQLKCARCSKEIAMGTTVEVKSQGIVSCAMYQGSLRLLQHVAKLLASSQICHSSSTIHILHELLIPETFTIFCRDDVDANEVNIVEKSSLVLLESFLPSLRLSTALSEGVSSILDRIFAILVRQLFPPAVKSSKLPPMSRPGPSLPPPVVEGDTASCSCSEKPPTSSLHSSAFRVSRESFYPSILLQAVKNITALKNLESNIIIPKAIHHILVTFSSTDVIEIHRCHLALSLLVHSLIRSLEEDILLNYKEWVQLVLHGIGLYGSDIARRYFTLSLKILVPLAPLALSMKKTYIEVDGSRTLDPVSRLISGVLCIEEEESRTNHCLLEELRTMEGKSSSSMSHGDDCSLEKDDSNAVKSDHAVIPALCLRKYQIRGVEWILSLWGAGLGGVLADDMGLGKTIQAISAMKIHRCRSLQASSMKCTNPYLVVCPALLVTHWYHETTKFSSEIRNDDGEMSSSSVLIPVKLMDVIKREAALHKKKSIAPNKFGRQVPDLSSRNIIAAHQSVHLASKVLSTLSSHHLVVISYTALRTMHRQYFLVADAIESGRYKSLELSLPTHHMFNSLFTSCVLDEGHVCRNPKSMTTQAVYAIQAKHRLVLTGTPLQNTVEDIWAAMQFILPDYLGPFSKFQKDMVTPIRQAFVDAQCSQLNVGVSDQGVRRMESQEKLSDKTADMPLVEVSSVSTNGNDLKEKKSDDNRVSIDPLLDSMDTSEGQKVSASEKNKVTQTSTKKQLDITATGLSLLRTLHSQVLPFILRRTKDVCLPDLPLKSIVEVYCPLSTWQQLLYGEVQRGLVKLSDDALVQQLEAHYFSKTKRRSLNEGVLVDPDKDDIRDLALNNKALPTLHPLNALIALKKVCVFPRSVSTEAAGTNGVIDNAIERFNMNLSYNNRKTVYQNCNRELQYSGKLCQLANVLVESGVVVTNSEINDHNSDDGEGNSNDIGLRGYPWTVKVDDVEGEVENSGSDEEDNEDSDDSDCGYDTASCSGSSSEDDEDGEKVNDNLRNSDNDSDDNDNESISSDTKLSENRKSENGDMKKCLIFAEHLHTLDVVEALVLKELFPSLRYSRLDGNVSAMQRALIADNFNRGIPTGSGMQADSMPSQVLLLTTGACGLGLNLSSVEVVIFVEHSWNPFTDLQAMDRVHRIGTSKPVTVYRLLAESTIETRIQTLQQQKYMLADEVIKGEIEDWDPESQS